MCKILIFGGTAEGGQLARFCAKKRIGAYVSSATDYGAAQLIKSPYIHAVTGRKTAAEMAEFIAKNDIDPVFDATHPYAVEATENIRRACSQTGAAYIRVLRETTAKRGDGIFFNDIPSVVEYLNNHGGNILLTTGSKELPRFRAVNGFSLRCTVRVLDADGIYEKCAAYGFDKIIAEKGPFSIRKNIAHLRRAGAKFIVTKDSGRLGGYDEKIAASKELGVTALIITRPAEDGIDVNKAKQLLEEYNGQAN